MTKSELIARLAGSYPQLVAKDAEFAVKTILDAMTLGLFGRTRLSAAARVGNVRRCAFLVVHGADVRARATRLGGPR